MQGACCRPKLQEDAIDAFIEVREVSPVYDTPGRRGARRRRELRHRRLRVLCLVGPSCGNTTLLNIIAGFLRPSRRDPIEEPRSPATAWTAGSSRISPSCFRGVRRSATPFFGLEMATGRARKIARRQLALVKLEKFVQSYPHHLSGGMQQWPSRALMYNPRCC